MGCDGMESTWDTMARQAQHPSIHSLHCTVTVWYGTNCLALPACLPIYIHPSIYLASILHTGSNATPSPTYASCLTANFSRRRDSRAARYSLCTNQLSRRSGKVSRKEGENRERDKERERERQRGVWKDWQQGYYVAADV